MDKVILWRWTSVAVLFAFTMAPTPANDKPEKADAKSDLLDPHAAKEGLSVCLSFCRPLI